MRKRIKKYLLIFFGLFFILLGIVGAVLPILPTTPFLILALTCFANSSPRFHQTLLNNPWFGSALQQWEQNRSISRKSKIKAMWLIVLSFAISITLLQGRLHLQLGLLIMGCILLTFIWRIKEARVVAVTIANNKD